MTGSSSERLITRFARQLHASGAPADQLEESVARVSRSLGVPTQVFATPTAVQLAFGGEGASRAEMFRASPGDAQLSRLVALDDWIDRIEQCSLAPDVALRELDALGQASAPFGTASLAVSFCLAAASACRLLGGEGLDVLATAVLGLLLAFVTFRSRSADLQRVLEPTAAALVAFASWFLPGVDVDVVTLSTLIVWLPGFTITTALRELSSRHLVSGTVRLAGALTSLLALGFGVALGRTLAMRLGTPPVVEPWLLPLWTEWLALVVAPFAFTVLFQARLRDFPAILVVSLLGFLAARWGAASLGPELGSWLGALVVGLAANTYARVARRPASVPLVPSIMLLVPGSLGFQSVSSFLEHDVLSGVETAFRMAVVAAALASGLLLAHVLLPPRRSL